MKISAIIATRGNPRRAGAVIEVTRAMASGCHEVEIVVACDNDDADTYLDLHAMYGAEIRLDMGHRPVGLGALFNRIDTDADIVMCMGDDGFPATPFWDEIVASHAAASPLPVAFAWHDLANPNQPTIICASKAWRDLTAPMLDERFPFWFADTAVAEVYSFVTGQQMPILPIVMANRPGRVSPRLRDMEFWWDFYAWTRAGRLEKAAEIRALLGLPEPANLPELVGLWRDRDARGRRFRPAEPTAPPDEGYLIAKAKAEATIGKVAA